MRQLKLNTIGPPAAYSDVIAFEVRHQISLPVGFRKFSLTCGEAWPSEDNCFLPVADKFSEYCEEYCASDGFPCGIEVVRLEGIPAAEKMIKVMSWCTGFGAGPLRFIPFASNGCSGSLVLGLIGSDFNRVFFVDAAFGGERFLVADSFEEFLDALTFTPEMEDE
jgi:hypothetical protein